MQPSFEPLRDRLPIIPEGLLRKHAVHEARDSRFKAAARLLQSAWRQDQGAPIGTHVDEAGKRRKLGSKVSAEAGKCGLNFISREVFALAHRELAYRENGAFIDEGRLHTNLLSSMPLCFNIFARMKLDLNLATAFVRHWMPFLMDVVDEVLFEHAPARGSERFTGDYTAFDVLIRGRSEDNRKTFIAIEVKYSESTWEQVREPKARCDEYSCASDLYVDGADPALRQRPLQQLWREHILAKTMVDAGLFAQGLLLVIAPRLNTSVQNTIATYRTHLRDPELAPVSFAGMDLEALTASLAEIGAPDQSEWLRRRYVDYDRVDALVDEALLELALPPPARKAPTQRGKRPAPGQEGARRSASSP